MNTDSSAEITVPHDETVKKPTLREQYTTVRKPVREAVLSSGADLSKPEQRHIARRAAFNAALITKQEEDAQKDELRQGAEIDELTGINNYKGYIRRIKEEVRRMRRTDIGFSYILLDLNGLKWINDNLGHSKGNEALKTTAEILLSNIREGVDSVARIGGDEFVVILPGTESEDVRTFWDRVNLQFIDRGIGICAGATEASRKMLPRINRNQDPKKTLEQEDEFETKLKDESDKALYQVKPAKGRDRKPEVLENQLCLFKDTH